MSLLRELCLFCGTQLSDGDTQDLAKARLEAGMPCHAGKPAPQATGETHYSKYPIQPIEFIEANNIPFAEANVIKYTMRWRDKHGPEDLKKAKWYIDHLIQRAETAIENLTPPSER